MSAVLARRLLLVLLLFSGAVRLAFFLEFAPTDLAAVPLLDSQTYHEWAMRLAAGDWGWHETYWMGPLYPHLVALVYVAFGVGSPSMPILQLALSLLNIYLLWRMALGLLGGGAPAQGTALLAATLYAFYGAPVFYAGSLLMATLVTTLLLLVSLQAERASRNPRLRSWFGLGLLVGLAGLARGNVLLLAGLLPLVLWLGAAGEGARPVPLRRRFGLTAALLAGSVLMLAPATLRNIIVADDFVLLTSNGGINLLIGQQTSHEGLFAPVMTEAQAEFDPSLEPTLERELGRDLKGSEVSRILTGRAWRAFRDNLSAMPLHYARKAYRFWNGYELPQIISYNYYRGQFGALQLLPVPFLLLSALGLAGLAWGSGGLLPRRARWLLVILIGGYFLSLLPFFPTSRYRQPIAPLLAIPAAAWLVAVMRQRAGRWRRLALGLGLIAALWPAWADLDRAAEWWQVHLHEASRAARRNNLAGTLQAGTRAEAVRPGLADTPYHLSLYVEELGEHEQAIALLRTAAERAPRNRLIPYRIGRNYEQMGQARPAVAAYEEAAALDPAWSYPWYRGGLVLNREGRKDEALRATLQAYRLAPHDQRIRSNLASLQAEAGDLAPAHRLLVSLTEDYPLYLNGWFNRALVEYQSGRLDDARRSLAVARSLRGITPAEQARLDELGRLLAAGPETSPQ